MGRWVSVPGDRRGTRALALIKLHTGRNSPWHRVTFLTSKRWNKEVRYPSDKSAHQWKPNWFLQQAAPTSALKAKPPADASNEMQCHPKKDKSIRRNRNLITGYFISSLSWGSRGTTAEGPSRKADYQKLGFFTNQTDSCGNPEKEAPCSLMRGLGSCGSNR